MTILKCDEIKERYGLDFGNVVSPTLSVCSRPRFTAYEAVVLLGVLLDRSFPDLVDKVSAASVMLRGLAISEGYDISPSYRNEKGISYQLQSMMTAYYNDMGKIPSTELFRQTVAFYNADRALFQEIYRTCLSLSFLSGSHLE